MKAGVQWLLRLFGPRRAEGVATAYRRALGPNSLDGQLILADLAHYCRLAQSSFVPGDPGQTAFNEGARDVFLHVAELIGITPRDFPQITQVTHDLRD